MPGPKGNHPNTLLVEGTNDQQFIYQLTNRAGIPRGTYLIPAWKEGGGFQILVDSLPGILASSVVQRLGIVVDADDAWQPKPGTSMGLAVQRQYLDGSATSAADFVQWLKRLFDLL